jgi:dTDP-glucose 4,6-dehydratase
MTARIAQSRLKRIMVTGGLGFIGSYFVRMALERGYEVVNVDKVTYAARQDLQFERYPNYHFVKADICEMTHLPVGVEAIVNFAAESHVDNAILANQDFFHSNVQGVYNLLELVRAKDETDRPLFVQISTDEVYGTILRGSFKETDRLCPSNPYSATKAAADQLVLGWKNTYGLPVQIIRSCNNYGFGQYPEKLLAKTIEFLLRGKKMTIHGDGSYRREWLYAGDNCEAIFLIMERGQVGEIYNVSSGEEHSVLEAASMAARAVGVDPKDAFVFIPNRPGQDLRYSVNSDKVRSLGWRPTRTLADYLPEYVALYRKHLGLDSGDQG